MSKGKKVDMNVLAPDAGLVTRFPTDQAGATGRAFVKASNVRMVAGRVRNSLGYQTVFGIPSESSPFDYIQPMKAQIKETLVVGNKTDLYSVGPNVIYVAAGPDATVRGSGYLMEGKVNGPSNESLTITWTQLYGPGTSTFIDTSLPTSEVTVDVSGVYGYQLSATDGTLISSDECVVTFILVPNEEQSYTAYCTPPATGSPSSATVPPGTYFAGTQSEANALALAEAQSLAVAALVCVLPAPISLIFDDATIDHVDDYGNNTSTSYPNFLTLALDGGSSFSPVSGTTYLAYTSYEIASLGSVTLNQNTAFSTPSAGVVLTQQVLIFSTIAKSYQVGSGTTASVLFSPSPIASTSFSAVTAVITDYSHAPIVGTSISSHLSPASNAGTPSGAIGLSNTRKYSFTVATDYAPVNTDVTITPGLYYKAVF